MDFLQVVQEAWVKAALRDHELYQSSVQRFTFREVLEEVVRDDGLHSDDWLGLSWLDGWLGWNYRVDEIGHFGDPLCVFSLKFGILLALLEQVLEFGVVRCSFHLLSAFQILASDFSCIGVIALLVQIVSKMVLGQKLVEHDLEEDGVIQFDFISGIGFQD